MSIVAVIPTCRVTGSSSLATAGGTSVTVTPNIRSVVPPGPVADTVTVAEPAATPVAVTTVPSMDTVAWALEEPSAP